MKDLKLFKQGIAFTSFLLLLTTNFAVAEKSVDRSNYNLFNPMPADAMGDMQADRPGKTESPYIVAPGHYQLEIEAYNYNWSRFKTGSEYTRETASSWFAPTLRVGVLDRVEFNLIASTYSKTKTKDIFNNTRETAEGFGDTLARFKLNFWGGDGKCNNALSLIPFVKFPTNHKNVGNNYFEGGLILPFDMKLNDDFNLNVMTEVDVVRSDTKNKHVASFVNAASIGYQATEKLGVSAEVFTVKTAESKSRWDVSVNFGAGYSLSDNVQVDAGVNVGVTKAADDFNPFLGFSIRF